MNTGDAWFQFCGDDRVPAIGTRVHVFNSDWPHGIMLEVTKVENFGPGRNMVHLEPSDK